MQEIAGSIHAPREGSDINAEIARLEYVISIHAPREGSDAPLNILVNIVGLISIHTPREGSDG